MSPDGARFMQTGIFVVVFRTADCTPNRLLLDMQDSELLSLCLSLNLISEEGYFMPDQSRDVRNNCSAAHPTIGSLVGLEFLNFLEGPNLVGKLDHSRIPGIVDRAV